MHFYFQTNEVFWVLHLAVCVNRHTGKHVKHQQLWRWWWWGFRASSPCTKTT